VGVFLFLWKSLKITIEVNLFFFFIPASFTWQVCFDCRCLWRSHRTIFYFKDIRMLLSRGPPFLSPCCCQQKKKKKRLATREKPISKLCPPQSEAFQQRQATIENHVVLFSSVLWVIPFCLFWQVSIASNSQRGEFNCDRVRAPLPFLREAKETVTSLPANFLSPLTNVFKRTDAG